MAKAKTTTKEKFILHEKTMEMNITHELLNLSNGWPWRHRGLKDHYLHSYWFWEEFEGQWHSVHKPAIAYGLHTGSEGTASLEGKEGGGFDAAILGKKGDFFAFIQYKVGELATIPNRIKFGLSTVDNSAFVNANPNTPKGRKRVVKPSQFQLFWNLFRKSQEITNQVVTIGDTNPCFYAFPAFTSMQEVLAHSGLFLERTRIVGINEIVDDAGKATPPIQLFDNSEHHYSFVKSDLSTPQIESDPKDASDRDSQYGFVGDIVMVRLWRALKYIDPRFRESSMIVRFLLTMHALWILGVYPTKDFIQWAQDYKRELEPVFPIIMDLLEFRYQTTDLVSSTWEKGIAKHMENRIEKFVDSNVEQFKNGTDIPVPDLVAFRPLSENGEVTFPKDFSFRKLPHLTCLVL